MVQDVGSGDIRELPERQVRFYSIGDQPVSLFRSELRHYSRSSGAIESTRLVGPDIMDRIWPAFGGVFYGE